MCSYNSKRVFIFPGPAVIIDHLAIFNVPKQEMLVYKVNLFNIFDKINLFVSAYSPYFQKKDTKPLWYKTISYLFFTAFPSPFAGSAF